MIFPDPDGIMDLQTCSLEWVGSSRVLSRGSSPLQTFSTLVGSSRDSSLGSSRWYSSLLRSRECPELSYWDFGVGIRKPGLAESSFGRQGVQQSKDRFDIVLKHLQEETMDHIRDLLRNVDSLVDPYNSLKTELIRLHSPNILEQLNGIVFAPELGGQPPSQLMNKLLGMLPAGEPASLLFKHLFILKLPSDLREQVAKKLDKMEARELAEYADSRWHARNSRPPPSSAVAAVESAEVEELSDTVAALSVGSGKNGRRRRPDKKGTGQRPSAKAYVCQKHYRFGKEAWSCDEPKVCTFLQGNGQAGGQ